MRFVSLFLVSAVRLTSAAITITADSWDGNVPNPPERALDGNKGTIWHTMYYPNNPPLPHHVNIHLGETKFMNGFTYLPRQDDEKNGNIGKYTLETSTDGTNFVQVAAGTFLDDKSLKQIGFPGRNVAHLRFTALTEAGNRGPWTSAAEFGFTPAPTSTVGGQWGPVIPFPLVPAGAFVEYNTGKILTFSSYRAQYFGGTGNTYYAVYDPATGGVTQRVVVNTAHDMFCPGLTADSTGRMIVTGGDDSAKTSIYDPATDQWTVGAQMKMGRGYQSSCSISDGRVFTIGGSWSGQQGNKGGEIYSPRLNTWTMLPGCIPGPMLTNDAQGAYRSDNHAWLFGWKNGYVFQAGPSKKMNWYKATETGGQAAAGVRGDDGDAMNGNAVMWDAVNGKILTMGGSPSYQNSDATANTYVITIGNPNTPATVARVGNMAFRRAFANAVVLPDGTIFVTGGEAYPIPFNDNTAVLTPELWNPATHTWTSLPNHNVPRTYHSVAILMKDARVFTGGGGLCTYDCDANHEDAQIYTPAYLYTKMGTLAVRPVINNSPTGVQLGTKFTVTTNIPCTSFSLIKYGSATHTVNTDQRRIAFTPDSINGNSYTFTMPADAGIAMPGYWMFFALNAGGVPSVASTIRVTIAPPP